MHKLSFLPFLQMSSGALTFVEGGKELFKVTLRLRSSILTREPLLHRFFAFCGTGLVDAAGKPKQVDAQAANLLKALLAVDLPTIIAFLPAVFNQLLQVSDIGDCLKMLQVCSRKESEIAFR